MRRIVAELLSPRDGPVLLTRADDEQADAALAKPPGGAADRADRHVAAGAAPARAEVAVVTAGTADLPVADECAATLTAHGARARPAHRRRAWPASTGCWPSADALADADAVVVVAGMEGALASLVGGITPAPVVAVPTSVGYGAALGGRDRPAGHARLVRRRAHRRRHRQRLRRRACAVLLRCAA